MQQMILPGTVDVVPRVSFDKPVTLERLQSRMGQSKQVMHSIVERARLLLKDHMVSNFAQIKRRRA